MSLHELEQFVVRWYYEQWSTTPLKRHMFTNPESGVTAKARWSYYTKESGYIMPLPVTEDAWRKVTLVRDERRLSSKTGITHEGLNYKGANLPYLVKNFFETKLTIYSDPRDYRFIYVDDGNQLVPLVEELVHSDTPAYTLAQEKERRSAISHQSKRTEATQFQRDVWEKALEPKAPKPRRKSTERNRATSEKHQQSQAVKRAIDTPVTADVMSEFVSKLEAFPTNFFDLEALPVLDRSSGEEKV